MAALKVKLVRGMSGHTERHRETLRALGLTKVGRERILPDNPSTRGMIRQVSYLVEWSATDVEFKPFGRPRSRTGAAEQTGEGTSDRPPAGADGVGP